MPKFTVIYRRADHADATSIVVTAGDIDEAASLGIERCDPEEYVVGVVQTDTPADFLCLHIEQHYNIEAV
jgi:hypothetical protein